MLIDKMRSVSFWVSLLAAGKIIAQLFGVEIDDAVINNVANGIAGVATIVGIVMSHEKKQSVKPAE